IQIQVQHGSASRSERWLKKLEEIDPNSLRALTLRSQVLVAMNDKADVEALVEPKAAGMIARARTADDKLRLIASVGDLYFTVKRDAAAERWYRKLLDESPRQYQPLV